MITSTEKNLAVKLLPGRVDCKDVTLGVAGDRDAKEPGTFEFKKISGCPVDIYTVCVQIDESPEWVYPKTDRFVLSVHIEYSVKQ